MCVFKFSILFSWDWHWTVKSNHLPNINMYNKYIISCKKSEHISMPSTYHLVTQLRYPEVHPGIPILFTDLPLLSLDFVLCYLWTTRIVFHQCVVHKCGFQIHLHVFIFTMENFFDKLLEMLRYKCVLYVCLSVWRSLSWSCTISNNVSVYLVHYIYNVS